VRIIRWPVSGRVPMPRPGAHSHSIPAA
jgi:hypothetical protein